MSATRDAIVQHLQADAAGVMSVAGDVYPGTPPEGASHPLVQVTAQRPPRGNYVFQGLSHEDSVYLVKAVDKNSSPKRAGEINAFIRARLDNAALSVDGQTTLLVSWVQDVEYSERTEDGTVYQHEGGLYEIWTEPEA